MYKDKFIKAINDKTKIRVTFFSKEDQHILVRICAPMDYAPSSRAHNKNDRFHFWDYESDKVNHVLSLLPNQIESMDFTQDTFKPSDFVTWNTNWIITRNWGEFS